jgi:hypothetical protein
MKETGGSGVYAWTSTAGLPTFVLPLKASKLALTPNGCWLGTKTSA